MSTPRGMRLHISLFGRRNVGKSSLLNALTRQQVSIVSEQPGTTTDPVEKPMELLPLGPVLFIDTAGIDDEGALGTLRVERTRRVFDRTDVGIVVFAGADFGSFEEDILAALGERGAPAILVANQADRAPADPALLAQLTARGLTVIATVAPRGEGIHRLRNALVRAAPDALINPPAILADLVPPGEGCVLVVPIDKEAPKGRIILPQVQSIRDLLDHDAWCVVVGEHQLKEALARFTRPPALVVTDSQAFLKVAADTPLEIPMTSFSILFARYKGDLTVFACGARAIDGLRPGDRVLVAEACTHHPIGDDIGRVKLPHWLSQYAGGPIVFDVAAGRDFPADLSPYRLVIHCGACVTNRREVLSRILHCQEAHVPITNYGVAIAYSLGVCERALAPFPQAAEALHADLVISAGPLAW